MEVGSPTSRWEIVTVLSQYLEPQTLASASCVSKDCFPLFTHDSLWKRLLSEHYPSLIKLKELDSSLSYATLFRLGFTAAKSRLETTRLKPRLEVNDLSFLIEVKKCDSVVFCAVNKCDEIVSDCKGLFKFSVDFDYPLSIVRDDIADVRVSWMVVLKGCIRIFSMMDNCAGKSNTSPSVEAYFLGKLPLPSGCLRVFTGSSAIAAEMKIEEGKITLSIYNDMELRYISLDEGLLVLQEFMLDTM